MPRRLPNSLTTASNRKPAEPDERESHSLGCLPLILLLFLVPLGYLLTMVQQRTAGALSTLHPVVLAPYAFVPHLAFIGLPDRWTLALSFACFSGYLIFAVLPLAVARKWFSLTACAIILLLFFLNATGCRRIISEWETWEPDRQEYRQEK